MNNFKCGNIQIRMNNVSFLSIILYCMRETQHISCLATTMCKRLSKKEKKRE